MKTSNQNNNPGQNPGQNSGQGPAEIPIQIDHKPYKASKPVMTALELRQLAKPPIGPDRDFFQVVPGQGDDIKLADNTSVELKPGMHFYSAPGTINPGGSCRLPECDEEYLAQKGFSWDVIPGGQGAYLILKGLPVSPERYDKPHVDLMLQIPVGYPDAKLDMFYVFPDLRLKRGGYPEAANVFEGHCGRQWQRFSRHLAAWQPGQDSLASFLALALGELQGKR